jgi:hypothetical protein
MPIQLANDDVYEEPAAPLMTLERIRASMRNTKHLAKSLLDVKVQRHYFDPNNAEDRIAYYVFSKTGKWIKQYYFDMPDTNAVAMCQRKLIEWAVRDDAARAQAIIDGINAAKSQAA